MEINYRILLKKYMGYIQSIEGTDYTDMFNFDGSWENADISEITKAEGKELVKLSKE